MSAPTSSRPARPSPRPQAEDLIAFDLPTGPATVVGAGPLLADLAHCLLDWRGRDVGPTDPAPRIRVRRQGDDFEVATPILPDGGLAAPDPLPVANALAGALTAEIPQTDPRWVQLHAAAALDAQGRLDLFLGASHAGKSTLALTLARRGRRLFADDRLAVRVTPSGAREGAGERAEEGPDDGGGAEGLALAVAPKLRLPAPDDWDAAALDWLHARTTVRRHDLAVLHLPPAELARLGETAPVARLLVLARDPAAAAPSLEPLSAAAALAALLPSCFAPALSATELLAWGRSFVAAVPAARLVYRSAESLSADSLSAESLSGALRDGGGRIGGCAA